MSAICGVFVDHVVYLGHVTTNQLAGNDDNLTRCRDFVSQVNNDFF